MALGCYRVKKQVNSCTIYIHQEENLFVAEHYIPGIVKEDGKYLISTDRGTWYQQACNFLELEHHLHSFREKSVIERTIQYIKDRTENFDYFPCRLKNCELKYARNWLWLFVDYHKMELSH